MKRSHNHKGRHRRNAPFAPVIKVSALAFIFFSGWTSVLRLGDWTPIYTVPLLSVLIFGALQIAIEKKIKRTAFENADMLIVTMIVVLLMHSVPINNERTINYLLAYTFVFLGQFLFLKLILAQYLKLDAVLLVNSAAIFVTCLFVTIDFFLYYVHGIDTNEFINRSREATATVAAGAFRRSYGFATEPTQLGFYLNVLGPLALWVLYEKCLRNQYWPLFLVGVFLYGTALILTFSTVTYVVAVVAYFLTYRLLRRVSIIPIVTAILFLLFLIWHNPEIVYSISEDIIGKLTLDEEYKSVSQRMSQLAVAYDSISRNILFGQGLGFSTTVNEMSSINWYLFLAKEAGVVPVILVFSYLLLIFKKLLLDKNNPYQIPIMIGFLSGCMHLATLSTFQYPNLWLLLSIYHLSYLSIGRIQRDR